MTRKIWSIDTSHNPIQEVSELLAKYRDGLNSQQDVVKARFLFNLDENNGTTKASFYIESSLIFLIVMNWDKNFIFNNHISGNTSLLKDLDHLEKALDSFVTSDESGRMLFHLIRCKEISNKE